MNSFYRLIIHRVADLFKMEHVGDKTKNTVTVYRTADAQLYALSFLLHLTDCTARHSR